LFSLEADQGAHVHASLGEPGEGAADEDDGAVRGQVIQNLCIGEAGVVVDHDVHVLQAVDLASSIGRSRVTDSARERLSWASLDFKQ